MSVETPVSETLCAVHREAFNLQLQGIADDAAEARAGVGKLLRIITEGNGREPLNVEVAKNSEFRERIGREGVTRRHRLDRWWIAVGGWALTIGLLIATALRT